MRLVGKRTTGLSVFLISSIVLLGFQLLPAVAQRWKGWARPGHQAFCREYVKIRNDQESGIGYLLYLPKNYSTQQQWPLLLFLHGVGERGDNLAKVTRHGPPFWIAAGKHFPFIVASPQCPTNANWQPSKLLAFVDRLQDTFSIDRKRIYVSGYSMGGAGAWALAAAAPARFAGLVPVAGDGKLEQAESLKNVPVWAFHGSYDMAIPIETTQKLIDAVNEQGGNAHLTVYQDRAHDICNEVFSRDNLYQWLQAVEVVPPALSLNSHRVDRAFDINHL